MTPPPWVPLLYKPPTSFGGPTLSQLASTWLNFQTNQYWANGAVRTFAEIFPNGGFNADSFIITPINGPRQSCGLLANGSWSSATTGFSADVSSDFNTLAAGDGVSIYIKGLTSPFGNPGGTVMVQADPTAPVASQSFGSSGYQTNTTGNETAIGDFGLDIPFSSGFNPNSTFNDNFPATPVYHTGVNFPTPMIFETIDTIDNLKPAVSTLILPSTPGGGAFQEVSPIVTEQPGGGPPYVGPVTLLVPLWESNAQGGQFMLAFGLWPPGYTMAPNNYVPQPIPTPLPCNPCADPCTLIMNAPGVGQ